MKHFFASIKRNGNLRKTIVVWSSLLSLILLIAILYYRAEKKKSLMHLREDIREISEIKINQFVSWHESRVADLKMFSESPFFTDAISRWVGNRDNEVLKNNILKRLNLINTNRVYSGIYITDFHGKVLISVGDTIDVLEDRSLEFIEEKLLDDHSFFNDFYLCHHHDAVHLDYIAPVKDLSGNVTSAIIFRVDLHRNIHTFLEKRLSALETTQNFIFRKEDDTILLVNVFGETTTVSSLITLPEGLSIDQGFGMAEDSQNERYLTYSMPIKGTDWHFLKIVNNREIDSFININPKILALTTMFIMAMLSLGFFALYHFQRKSHFKQTILDEREISNHYKKYHTILGSVTDGIITFDEHGIITQVNSAAESICGFTEESVLGVHVNKVSHCLPGIVSMVTDVLKSRQTISLNLEFPANQNPTGHLYTVVTASPIHEDGGGVQGVVLTIHDNTLETIATQKIAESEERYRSLFNNMSQGFSLHTIITNEQGIPIDYTFVEVNRAFEEMTGVQKADLTGRTVFEVFPKTEKLWIEVFGNVALSGNPTHFDEYFQQLDKHFSITAFSPKIGQFAVISIDITERKKAEKELREQKEFIQTALDNLPIGITLKNISDGVSTYANKCHQEIYGWSINEIGTFNTFFEKVFPDEEYRKQISARIMSDMESGIPERMKWEGVTITRKSGAKRVVDAMNIPFEAQNTMISIAMDVTERTQALDALVESEQIFSSLFYNSHTIMLIVNPKTLAIVDANSSAEQFYGYSREELTHMKISDISTLPEDMIREKIKEASNQTHTLFLFKHRTKEGIRDVEATTSIIRQQKRELVHMIIHDITDKKKSEEQVLMLSKSIELSPASVIITNARGKVEYVNPKFSEISGYSSEEVLGMNLEFLNADEEANAIYHELWSTVLAGNNWSGEMKARKKNGEIYWHATTISPTKDDDGNVRSTIAVSVDITEKKRGEEELQERDRILQQQNEMYLALNEELLESNTRVKAINEELILARRKAEENDRLKSAFLANMSHEIRTPMNAIIGFSEMLLNPRLSSDKKENFSRILNGACHQLLNMIEDVIDISKIETEQVELFEEETNINEVISRLIEIFKPQAKAKKIVITCSKCNVPKTNIIVITDTTKLNQILTNLLSNAIKFTNQGTIEVGYSVKGEMVEFFVRDTGIGIAPKHHSAIFDRFRQVDLEDTRKYGGTGLGLSISKAFVEMLGGNIWLESEVGKGTTFFFTIPHKLVAKTRVAIPASYETIDFTGKKILVAEDEETNFIFIREVLLETNATLKRAKDGVEAVDIYIKTLIFN